MSEHRTERDSLGEVRVPAGALYGAQTQRAIENFQISRYRFSLSFIAALAEIKHAAAAANLQLGVLEEGVALAIQGAAREIGAGAHTEQFPLDVFQTGSGTSLNMNMNEVIASLASTRLGSGVHPNDHVNRSQSSNDVIPSAIQVSAALAVSRDLLPALDALAGQISLRRQDLGSVVKTARTHLMDAVPIRLEQEMSGWETQVREAAGRLRVSCEALWDLPLGGTAVGTGLNAPPQFDRLVCENLANQTGLPFRPASNKFARISGQDAALAISAQLRGSAVVLLKISNDLRWMNSGPTAGLAEITLPVLQPGSSAMPGKVNPVIPEAVAMACTYVLGNDHAIALAAQSGSFQLNTMLPLVAWALLDSIEILGNASRALSERAIAGFVVQQDRMAELVARNPILVTALVPEIGYDLAAKIAQESLERGESILEVAKRRTRLDPQTLAELLDPARMTGPA